MVHRVVAAATRRRYARRARRLYANWVRPGSLVFDVGANMGERTRVLLSLGARVVAVEPQPDCVASLRGIRDERLTVEAVALGAEKGTAPMRVATASTISSMSDGWISNVTGSGRFPGHEWGESITVEVTTLDALLKQYGVPDFCKVDVEGYESEVFAGLSRPLPLVSFEFTPEWANDTLRVVEQLRELGVERFNLSIGESHELFWADWGPSEALTAHLSALPDDAVLFADVYAAS
jgi:FkbM family methyltransferase